MGTTTASTTLDRHPVLRGKAELRRCLLAHILWEEEFFEQGRPAVGRLRHLVARVPAKDVAALAIEAREQFNLWRASLSLVREMARFESHRTVVAETLARVIQQPDELSEFVSIYWRDGRQPLSAQVKKGLAAAFAKLGGSAVCAKQSRGAIPLKDVLFLCHAKPKDLGQEVMWQKLADQRPTAHEQPTLPSGKGKREVWERLLREGSLDAKLLLHNFGKLSAAGVSSRAVRLALRRLNADALPFDFLIAGNLVPKWRMELGEPMLEALKGQALLSRSSLVINIAEPEGPVSSGNLLLRRDAAAGLAILLCEVAKGSSIYTSSEPHSPLPQSRGFQLADAIRATESRSADRSCNKLLAQLVRKSERIILITDQSVQTRLPAPGAPSYLINLNSKRNCISYSHWTRLDGWSEHIIDYIRRMEHTFPI